MIKYSYDTDKYPLHKIVMEVFGISELNKIHLILNDNLDIPDDPSKDQSTVFHKKFYKIYEDEKCNFLNIYRDFIKNIITEHFNGKKMYYQTKPTFRVQIPNNIAVAKWHKDKAYNHSNNEINIFLPLTEAFDTNTIWTESEEDKGDFAPMNAKFGEYYLWDGANLSHGNKKNETGVSRVSIDFRIISSENFNYSGTSVTSKIPMSLGSYWSEI